MKGAILGELEQRIMNLIWESDHPLRPIDVCEKLSNQYAYSTIVTILTRLYNKEILHRQKCGKVYHYWAQKSREEFANSKLKNLFKGILDNYGQLAISQFVDSIEDNPEDLVKLKQYLLKKSDGIKS